MTPGISQRKIVCLVQVRNERKAAQAKYMRRDMHCAVRSACRGCGDDLSGYALVAWDRMGNVHTAINQGLGPFGWCALPNQCRDAINRHIAIALANPEAASPEPEGA